MKSLVCSRIICATLAILSGSAWGQSDTALVRHAPTLNRAVEGSIRQMTAESVTLNGNASVTGDLRIPGTPEVRLNGNPAYGGTLDGTGTATPTTHRVTLNGGARLGRGAGEARQVGAAAARSRQLPPFSFCLAGMRSSSVLETPPRPCAAARLDIDVQVVAPPDFHLDAFVQVKMRVGHHGAMHARRVGSFRGEPSLRYYNRQLLLYT